MAKKVIRIPNRVQRIQGENITATIGVNEITLPDNGNFFLVETATVSQIDEITLGNWDDGSEIDLMFDGICTLTHNASLLFSQTESNIVTTHNDIITFIKVGSVWYQKGSAPMSGSTGTYVHNQASPATVWSITHNLSKYPSITVVDSSGNVVTGDYQYINQNQVDLNFSSAFSGMAYLN
jgi:hypothetical protein